MENDYLTQPTHPRVQMSLENKKSFGSSHEDFLRSFKHIEIVEGYNFRTLDKVIAVIGTVILMTILTVFFHSL